MENPSKKLRKRTPEQTEQRRRTRQLKRDVERGGPKPKPKVKRYFTIPKKELHVPVIKKTLMYYFNDLHKKKYDRYYVMKKEDYEALRALDLSLVDKLLSSSIKNAKSFIQFIADTS